MGNFGAFASRFSVNTKSLEEYDEALRFFKEKSEETLSSDEAPMISKLLNVINPILENIRGDLSESTAISDQRVSNIVKERHHKDWPIYKERIQQLQAKLSSSRFTLAEEDFKLLDDIGDALEAECANLYLRMGERP